METVIAAVGLAPTGASPVTQVSKYTFTASFGAVSALTGTTVTQTITGLQVGDVVNVICTSSPPSGMVIANARVSASNTLEIFFGTSVAVGITLGSLNFSVIAFR